MCSDIPNGSPMRAFWPIPIACATATNSLLRSTRCLARARAQSGCKRSIPRARGMVLELDHPQAGVTRALGSPLHFSATPGGNTLPAPLLGQHTREVLRECGYSDAEIDDFVAEGVIVAGP